MPAPWTSLRLCSVRDHDPGGRGVANLESRAGAHTSGVLYLMTAEQSEHLDRTGARVRPQHGLPPCYLDYLRTFDLAADERLNR